MPEPLMISVKVCELATMPTTREKAGDGVSAAEGELSMRMDCATARERVLLIPC